MASLYQGGAKLSQMQYMCRGSSGKGWNYNKYELDNSVLILAYSVGLTTESESEMLYL